MDCDTFGECHGADLVTSPVVRVLHGGASVVCDNAHLAATPQRSTPSECSYRCSGEHSFDGKGQVGSYNTFASSCVAAGKSNRGVTLRAFDFPGLRAWRTPPRWCLPWCSLSMLSRVLRTRSSTLCVFSGVRPDGECPTRLGVSCPVSAPVRHGTFRALTSLGPGH